MERRNANILCFLCFLLFKMNWEYLSIDAMPHCPNLLGLEFCECLPCSFRTLAFRLRSTRRATSFEIAA